jgi:predicted dehydrogenase
MSKINIGIIGAGVIFRLMHLPVLKKLERKFNIVKIYDIERSAFISAARVMKKLKYPFEKNIWAESSEEIFNDGKIDAVAVLTGINSHLDYTLKALNSSKHVFLEKPAALSVKEIQKMDALSAKKKKLVQVGMVLRHSRWFSKLKEIIDSGKYGRVHWMHWLETRPFDPMNWRYDSKNKNGDAIINDKAVHQVNLFNAFAGSVPRKVMAMGGQYMLNNSKVKKLRTFNKEVLLRGDSNDHLMAIIGYENGVKADLLISYISAHARESRWVIQLEKAKIVTHFETFVKGNKKNKFGWDKNPSTIYLFKDDSSYKVPWRIPMSYPPSEKNLVFYDEYSGDPLHPGATKQWMEFYRCIKSNTRPECSLSLAALDTKVTEAICKSVKNERVVRLQKF